MLLPSKARTGRFGRLVVLLSVFFLFTGASSLYAQSSWKLRTADDCVKFCEQIMEFLVEEDYVGAFGNLREVSVPQIRDDVYNLQYTTAEQIEGIKGEFGQIVKYTHVSTDKIADVLLSVRYIELFQNHGLRWEFMFYKSGSTWQLDNIFWDDKLSELF